MTAATSYLPPGPPGPPTSGPPVSGPATRHLPQAMLVPIEGALVRRAREGDAKAFRQIFERHAPPVRRFLLDLLGDVAAADEATQETFVRAHGRLSTVRDTDKLLSWLFGI